MKMGLEKKLKDAIPEITQVVEVKPDMAEFNKENLERVLEGVRPFLKVAGGDVAVLKLI